MTLKETFNKMITMLQAHTVIAEEVVVINLEKQKLEDGITVIESESFEAGQSIFIVTESGESIPMPIGSYKMENGSTLEVVEEGIIDSIGDAPVEEPVEEEVPVDAVEEEAPEEAPEDAPEEEVVDTVTREEFDALKAMIEEMKANMELSKTTLLSKETEIENLKVELAATPATKKINHTPTEVKTELNNQKAVPAKTSLDRIFQRINKNK